MIYLSFNFYYHLFIFCHVVPETQGTASYSPRQRLDPNFQVSCSVLFYYLLFHFYLLYFCISFFIFSMLFYFNFFNFLSYFTFPSCGTRDLGNPSCPPHWRLDPSFQVSCSVLMFYYLIVSFFSFILFFTYHYLFCYVIFFCFIFYCIFKIYYFFASFFIFFVFLICYFYYFLLTKYSCLFSLQNSLCHTYEDAFLDDEDDEWIFDPGLERLVGAL